KFPHGRQGLWVVKDVVVPYSRQLQQFFRAADGGVSREGVGGGNDQIGGADQHQDGTVYGSGVKLQLKRVPQQPSYGQDGKSAPAVFQSAFQRRQQHQPVDRPLTGEIARHR